MNTSESAATALGLDYEQVWIGFAQTCYWMGLVLAEGEDGNSASLDDDGSDASSIPDDVAAQMAAVLSNFLGQLASEDSGGAVADYLAVTGDSDKQFGHDFALTRAGHGTGFWDREAGEAGDYLATVADAHRGEGLYAFVDESEVRAYSFS